MRYELVCDWVLNSYSVAIAETNLPPAIRLTVSKTWSDLICVMTTPRSKIPGSSVALLLMHRTKWGLAWTKVRNKLSSLVWKSCVKVETGSSPLNLQQNYVSELCKQLTFMRSKRCVTDISVTCEVGEILKLTPLGTVSVENKAFSSDPKRWVANPKLQLCLWNTATRSSGTMSRFVSVNKKNCTINVFSKAVTAAR